MGLDDFGKILGLLDGKGGDIMDVAGLVAGPEGEKLLKIGEDIKGMTKGGGGQGVGQSGTGRPNANDVKGNVTGVIIRLTEFADLMVDDPEKEKVIRVIGDLAKLSDALGELKKG